MNRYGIRAAKYVLQFTIIFVVFFAILRLTNYTQASFSTMMTSQGLMLLAIIVIFALIQPFLGYTKKTLVFDATKRMEDVDRVMGMCGYIKISDSDGIAIFRASSTAKRISMVYEDQITITTTDGLSVMQGPRKEVVKIYFRMGTFIS